MNKKKKEKKEEEKKREKKKKRSAGGGRWQNKVIEMGINRQHPDSEHVGTPDIPGLPLGHDQRNC